MLCGCCDTVVACANHCHAVSLVVLAALVYGSERTCMGREDVRESRYAKLMRLWSWSPTRQREAAANAVHAELAARGLLDNDDPTAYFTSTRLGAGDADSTTGVESRQPAAAAGTSGRTSHSSRHNPHHVHSHRSHKSDHGGSSRKRQEAATATAGSVGGGERSDRGGGGAAGGGGAGVAGGGGASAGAGGDGMASRSDSLSFKGSSLLREPDDAVRAALAPEWRVSSSSGRRRFNSRSSRMSTGTMSSDMVDVPAVATRTWLAVDAAGAVGVSVLLLWLFDCRCFSLLVRWDMVPESNTSIVCCACVPT